MSKNKRVKQSFAHRELDEIPERILEVAIGALVQANQNAVYFDYGIDVSKQLAVLNAVTSAELFLKAIIAKQHPLLIFRDIFQLDDNSSEQLTINSIIKRGKTYSFEQLPRLLWAVTGERLPDIKSFDRIREARNSIQHFCATESRDELQEISLKFIYNNIDPLIHKHFGLYAIEYHQDNSIDYSYVVSCLIDHELFFSVPPDFRVGEIDLEEELSKASAKYRNAIKKRIAISKKFQN